MTSKSVLAAVLLVLPASAFAQSIDASGAWIVTPGSVEHPVSEELVVVHIDVTHERLEPVDPENPMAGSSGRCFGALLIRAGEASGGGNCHYDDGDGDMFIIEWTAEEIGPDGMFTGSWAFGGGSGKWTDATGSGTFSTGIDEVAAQRVEITGELTMD